MLTVMVQHGPETSETFVVHVVLAAYFDNVYSVGVE